MGDVASSHDCWSFSLNAFHKTSLEPNHLESFLPPAPTRIITFCVETLSQNVASPQEFVEIKLRDVFTFVGSGA